jgi:hypothetical protein
VPLRFLHLKARHVNAKITRFLQVARPLTLAGLKDGKGNERGGKSVVEQHLILTAIGFSDLRFMSSLLPDN